MFSTYVMKASYIQEILLDTVGLTEEPGLGAGSSQSGREVRHITSETAKRRLLKRKREA